jgi:DNA modification methylase
MLRLIPHPSARPLVKDESFEGLVNSVREFGQQLPLLAVRGPHNGDVMVFDGIRRQAACEVLGMKPADVKYTLVKATAEELPTLWAQLNSQRFELTEPRRAAYCVKFVLPARIDQAKQRQRQGSAKLRDPDDAGKACAKAAADCNCKTRNVEILHSIHKQFPELVDDVYFGRRNVNQAKSECRTRARRSANANAAKSLPSTIISRAHDTIVVGDCLHVMPTLPRRKFRMFFADPPYNEGIDYGEGSKADKRPDADYLAWCERWMREIPELLTPDGSAWILINQRFLGEYICAMKRTRLKLRKVITWYETFGVNCADNFNSTSRYLLYFVKDPARCVFNHDVFNRPSDRLTKYNDARANPAGKLWDDVWFHIPRLTANSKERLPDFPTQLPEELLRPIIEGCTERGDEVCDPFNGSGTTGAAALKLGRKYLGIEKQQLFADRSRQRLAQLLAGAKS